MFAKHAFDDGESGAMIQDPELMRQLFGDDGMREIQAFQELRGTDPGEVSLDGHPVICPECGKLIESINDFVDAPADMRDHYAIKHPGKKNPYGR